MRYLALAFFAPAFAAPSLDRVPAWFEPNAGQFGTAVKFYSRGANGTVLLENRGAAFRLPSRAQIRMEFAGGNAEAKPETGVPQPAKTNYFLGSRESWKTDIPHFDDVRYRGVYRGIDAVFYASGKHLEYDFVVAPGADPSIIRLRFLGARPRIDPDGNLVLRVGKLEDVKHLAPVVYQKVNGRRVEIPAKYAINRKGEVRFMVGAYDRERELVIDPVLTYSNYLGGGVIDQINASAVDNQGRLWVTGATYSQVDLPLGTQPPQETNSGDSDAFLAAIGTTPGGAPVLLYYTYLGGAGTDAATAIAIDPYGYINLTGYTNSISFPLGGNAKQIALGGDFDGFVTQIHPQDAGAISLFYSSYYGGPGREFPQAIAASKQMIAVTGYTDAGVIPGALTSLQPSNRGGLDAFLFVTNPYAPTADESLRYASFLGGNGADLAPAVAIESSAAILVAGSTTSTDFPLAGPSYQGFLSGRGDGYVARIDINRLGLDALVYATYLGGRENDSITAIKLEPSGALWLAGYTFSPDFPTTIDCIQRAYKNNGDAFAARLDLTQSSAGALTYATYIGGTGFDLPYGLALAPDGKVWIAGYTNSSDYPRVAAPNPQPAVSLTEGFVTQLDPLVPGADGILLSMLFGGAGTDVITSVTLDSNGNAFASGYSTSSNLPTTTGEGKPNVLGLRSGFYLRVSTETQASQP